MKHAMSIRVAEFVICVLFIKCATFHLKQLQIEPKITNKAVRLIGNWGATPNAFEGCLDYIFYSNGLEPVDTTPFPSAEELSAVSYPTSAIPSDHLLMGCSFNLKSKEEESKL